MKHTFLFLIFLMTLHSFLSAQQTVAVTREKLLMDNVWRFAPGNAVDAQKAFRSLDLKAP